MRRVWRYKSLLKGRKCYSEFTNIEKRNSTRQRYNDALEHAQSTVAKTKAGRPPSNVVKIKLNSKSCNQKESCSTRTFVQFVKTHLEARISPEN